MRKFLLLIFTLFIVSWVKAQGHYDGQVSINAAAGIHTNKAFAVNLNVQKLFYNNYFGLRGDIMYTTTSNYDLVVIVPEKMKLETYNIGVSALYSFEKFIKFPFYFNIFLGGNYTYEYLNNGLYVSSLGIPFHKPEENTYGVYGGLEFEYVFYKNLAVTLTSLNQYNFNSSLMKEKFSGLIGIKYNF